MPDQSNQDFYIGEYSWAVNEEETVTLQVYEMHDAHWDRNGDGRFNILDIDVYNANVGAMGAPYVPDFDFDVSGDFDAGDLAIVQSVQSGYGSMIFGDTNGDNILTCADRWQGPATPWNISFCDAGYTIALDVDIDGDLDSFDEAAFNALNLPVDIDFNNDGLFPDTGDLDDFMSVYSGGSCSNDPDCDSIDINMDGLFPTTEDVETFVSALTGGGC